MFTLTNIVLIICGVLTALMAGLFYAWSFSITPGLARLSNAAYIESMQATNRAIQNPVFFVGFFGALLLLPVTTFLHYQQPLSMRFWFLLAASIMYMVGVFGVTIFGNIPLNISLDKFDLGSATEQSIARQRAAFEKRWNSLNMVRTVTSGLSILLLIIACLNPHRAQISE